MAEIETEVGVRLSAIMSVFGIQTKEALSAICLKSPSNVNNWLHGYQLQRIPEMILLCEHTGISLDWIYTGKDKMMFPILVTKLDNETKAGNLPYQGDVVTVERKAHQPR